MSKGAGCLGWIIVIILLVLIGGAALLYQISQTGMGDVV